jgi:hydrogenase nickel incorporation protein HypA/HybF
LQISFILKIEQRMHEVSIAANILEIVGNELSKHNGANVEKLHLQIGSLSGVVVDSLRFALDVSKKNSVLHSAEIVIDEIAARASCCSCAFVFDADDYFVTCPRCQGCEIEFLSGKELLIKSIVIT